ncbi:MAG: RDD family protein, partial [Chthoniobacteraceae bacterium]
QSYPTRVKYRTFLPRLWTMFVDSGVLWPVTVFIVLMYGMPQHAVAATAGALIGQIIYWCYMVIMHAKYGQTVGKMACRIKVVDAATEQAITFRQALLREGIPIMMGLGTVGYGIYFLWTGRPDVYFSVTNGNKSLFWILAGPPTLWFLAEVITMFTNEKRRALHDLIAGTVVVRTNLDESAREQAVEIGKGPVAGASYDY